MVPEIWTVTDITFCHSEAFFALLPHYGPRKSKFSKKWKKHLKILSFYKHKSQSWCMVPQIWSAMDRIFCHFGLFLALLPPYEPRKLRFWKNEKNAWRYYHFTCNINDNHMMYDSWHTECNGQNFLSFWTIFCSFTTLKTKKIKVLKKWKNTWRYYHFTKVNHKWQSLWCMVHEIWNVMDRIFFHFGLFFALTTRKIKILKNWKKNCWRYHHFTQVYQKWQSYDVWFLRYEDIFCPLPILHMCTKNYDQMMYGSWDMVCNRRMGEQMERQMDEWKKWHIEVGPPKKWCFHKKKFLKRFCIFDRKRP